MNVAAYEEKDKTTAKGKEGKKGRQATDFKEASCCTSAVVQGKNCKKMICVRGVPGITGTLGKANSHFVPTQTGLGTAPQR